ncbi:MAG: undecaprenyl-diphosphate phosphatase [Pseudomonadota bacterium]
MDPLQALILALIQGLTEFLPVSSSGHLVIPSLLLGWPDQGLAFDVAVHVGTLAAVLLYFRGDLYRMAIDWLRAPLAPREQSQSYMVWLLLAATLPAVVLGLLLGDWLEATTRSLPVIATTTLLFGLLLGLADRRAAARQQGAALTLRVALLVGLGQATALVPGVSRSGVTITVGLLLGMDRQSAARFSFLLSIPVILGAGLLKVIDLLQSGVSVQWPMLVLATIAAGLVAYLCIDVFLRWLDRIGLMPFVWYRVALAALLYAIWLSQ